MEKLKLPVVPKKPETPKTTAAEIRVICCYCKELIRIVTSENPEHDGQISAGMCKPCYTKEMNKLKGLRLIN